MKSSCGAIKMSRSHGAQSSARGILGRQRKLSLCKMPQREFGCPTSYCELLKVFGLPKIQCEQLRTRLRGYSHEASLVPRCSPPLTGEQSTRKDLGTGLRGGQRSRCRLFGDVMKFRAKSSEREGNAWVLGCHEATPTLHILTLATEFLL